MRNGLLRVSSTCLQPADKQSTHATKMAAWTWLPITSQKPRRKCDGHLFKGISEEMDELRTCLRSGEHFAHVPFLYKHTRESKWSFHFNFERVASYPSISWRRIKILFMWIVWRVKLGNISWMTSQLRSIINFFCDFDFFILKWEMISESFKVLWPWQKLCFRASKKNHKLDDYLRKTYSNSSKIDLSIFVVVFAVFRGT